MRILLVNQFFWPDVAATGQLLTDLARRLATEHEVTVICSGGSYHVTESEEPPPPVKIIRVPGSRYSRGVLARALSYSTFFAGALWHELRAGKQDMVITLTTPPMLSVGGTMLKALRGTRHYIWEMDLFPDALVSLDALKKGSFVERALGFIADFCRRRADGIIALGPCMRRRLIARGIPKNLIHVAENWADGNAIFPQPKERTTPINIFYSGNLGLSHDIETIAAAMRHFRNDSRFVFTFAGGGANRTQLERACRAEGIANAQFLPYCGRDEMGDHFAQADVGLVTERPCCIGTVVPSKIYGLMAAGKPILFVGPRRATPDVVLRRFDCGWQVEPGDAASLISLLERLPAEREEIRLRGLRARRAFEKHYDLPHGVDRITEILGLGASVAVPEAEPVAGAASRFAAHC
jgi:glycosyltransferase involved in cell wall biosynthesis